MTKTTELKKHPAQLWIGPEQELIKHAIEMLQQLFCTHGGCTNCVTCKQIGEQQHHAVTWINPEKQYTLEMITPILHQLSFTLGHNEHHVFILQKADTLSAACANRLLKSLEEPPHGYHFILFAQRRSALLPTIRSRTLIKEFHTSGRHASQHEQLKQFFLNPSSQQLNAFLATLQTNAITEQESPELVDQLLRFWIGQYQEAVIKQKPTAQTESMIHLLQDALATAPMPGSAKLFWKNLFLQAVKTIS